MLLHLALAYRLRSTEQLAFVMAHELAHYHLNHVNQRIFGRIEFLNSETTKKKAKASRKGKAFANRELLSWLGNHQLNLNQHSREHELQTDSLGLVFFLNAGFAPSAALAALQALAVIDRPKYTVPPLETWFDFLGGARNFGAKPRPSLRSGHHRPYADRSVLGAPGPRVLQTDSSTKCKKHAGRRLSLGYFPGPPILFRTEEHRSAMGNGHATPRTEYRNQDGAITHARGLGRGLCGPTSGL